jgi:hypothetical protein
VMIVRGSPRAAPGTAPATSASSTVVVRALAFLQIALSWDIPASVRWFIEPIVERISRDSMSTILQRTREAVRSNIAACDGKVSGAVIISKEIARVGAAFVTKSKPVPEVLTT